LTRASFEGDAPMKNAHPLLLAAALVGPALFASRAEAKDFVKAGGACVPEQGYASFVQTDPHDGSLFDVGQFAYVDCFGRDPGGKTMNVSKVSLSVADSDANDTIVCVIDGRDSATGNKTFGPLLGFSGGAKTGRAVISVKVPQNNKTSFVFIQCYLPAPTAIGPSGIFSYTVSTR
jgi:hypothetical protein